MKKKLALLALVFAPFVNPLVAGAATTISVSATASPATLAAKGGRVTLHVVVHGATHCTFTAAPAVAGFAGTVPCSTGAVVRSGVASKDSGAARTIRLRVVAVGAKASASSTAKVRQSGSSKSGSASASTLDACSTPSCTVAFTGGPDIFDMTSFSVHGAYVGVPCPEPGACQLPAGDELIEVQIAVGFGPTGTLNGSLVTTAFSLVTTSGVTAPMDDVTDAKGLTDSLGNLAAVAPDGTASGDMWFDAPKGAGIASVDYAWKTGSSSNTYVAQF